MSSGKIKITWIGHSCFKIESEGYAIIFDPYSPESVPGLKPVGKVAANEVISSHDHFDHNCIEEVKIETGRTSPFIVNSISTFHDGEKGSLRGENNITILESSGIRIVHFGDLGCELTKQQMSLIGTPDVILIPVGGFYTIDAGQAFQVVQQIKPKTVIPMHFRDDKFKFGFGDISEVKPFVEKISKEGVYKINDAGTSEITISGGEEYNVTILKPEKLK